MLKDRFYIYIFASGSQWNNFEHFKYRNTFICSIVIKILYLWKYPLIGEFLKNNDYVSFFFLCALIILLICSDDIIQFF